MGSFAPMTPDQRSDEFDSLVTYLSAVSQRLSQAELLDIADTLHELIRRRKTMRRSWRMDREPTDRQTPQSYSS
jgi:hypothetical protein